MKESEFQRRLVKALTRIGAVILNLNPNERMGIGWPDLYVGHPDWQGWIELKVNEGRLRVPQLQRIAQLRKAQVSVCVLRLDAQGYVLLEDEERGLWARIGTLAGFEASPKKLLDCLPLQGDTGVEVFFTD